MQTLSCLLLTCLLASCGKDSSNGDKKKDGHPESDAVSLDDVDLASLAPTSLAGESLLDAVKNLDYLESQAPAAAGVSLTGEPYFMCETEVSTADSVTVDGDLLTMTFKADVTTCVFSGSPSIDSYSKAEFSFTSVFSCPLADLSAYTGAKASDFKTGVREEPVCNFDATHSKRFRTSLSLTSDHTLKSEINGRSGALRTLDTLNLGLDDAPCELVALGDGRFSMAECRLSIDEKKAALYSDGKRDETYVTSELVTTNARALAGRDHYYAGSLAVSINDWTGTGRYHGDDLPPLLKLTNATMSTALVADENNSLYAPPEQIAAYEPAIVPPEGTELHMIGVYQPPLGTRAVGVVVEANAPIVLYLGSYDPVDWQLSGPGLDHVKKVLVGCYEGNGDSSVVGVDAAFVYEPLKTYFYDELPDPATVRAGALAESLTGLWPTSVQAANVAASFTVPKP